MRVLKIGVVEDELIVAGSIIKTLTEIGYHTTEAAISYSEALVMLHDEQPDMLILDINLSGKKDGIDLARYINEKLKIPFIFLTANSDPATLERAKKVNPHAYLVKPFVKEELYVSIEIAFNNFNLIKNQQGESLAGSSCIRDAIFLRNKQSFTKVGFNEIRFIESCENYIYVYLADGSKLMHRSTLTDFLTLIPAKEFYRCHRSYVVRIDSIKKIEDNDLIINDHRIPVGKDRMDQLMLLLGIEM